MFIHAEGESPSEYARVRYGLHHGGESPPTKMGCARSDMYRISSFWLQCGMCPIPSLHASRRESRSGYGAEGAAYYLFTRSREGSFKKSSPRLLVCALAPSDRQLDQASTDLTAHFHRAHVRLWKKINNRLRLQNQQFSEWRVCGRTLAVSRPCARREGEHQIRCFRNFFLGGVVLLFLRYLPGGLDKKDTFCRRSTAGRAPILYDSIICATTLV